MARVITNKTNLYDEKNYAYLLCYDTTQSDNGLVSCLHKLLSKLIFFRSQIIYVIWLECFERIIKWLRDLFYAFKH